MLLDDNDFMSSMRPRDQWKNIETSEMGKADKGTSNHSPLASRDNNDIM